MHRYYEIIFTPHFVYDVHLKTYKIHLNEITSYILHIKNEAYIYTYKDLKTYVECTLPYYIY